MTPDLRMGIETQRSHIKWTLYFLGAREPKALSPHAAATEVHAPRACALQQEKPAQWEARSLQLEKAYTQQQTPNAAENN